MAIRISSDLVLGVANAADPSKREAAAERLRRASPAVDTAWEAVVTAAPKETAKEKLAQTVAHRAAHALSKPAVASATPAAVSTADKVFGDLEAFVLQGFMQAILPQNTHGTFGKGVAGDTWKSMLAEKLAAQLAHSGQLGLAKRLSEGRAKVAGTTTPASLSSQPRGPLLHATTRLQSNLAAARLSLPDAAAVTLDPIKRS